MIDDRAHAEAEQDSLFHPAVHAPAGGSCGVRLGRANLSGVQSLLEAPEKLRVLGGIKLRGMIEKLFDFRTKILAGLLHAGASGDMRDSCLPEGRFSK